MKPPHISDRTGWEQQILEHRRALFEYLIAAYPGLLTTKRTVIDIWRAKLGGRTRGL
jgi:hypothetical protein